jgi:hypothetical protein
VVGVYRGFKLPPGKNRISFFNSIITSLTKLCQTNKLLTVGGDFNVDLLKRSSNLHDLDNWAIRYGLDQIITEITRQRVVQTKDGYRVESSIIDHLYTNAKDWCLNLIPSVSDHNMIEVTRKLPSNSTRQKLQVRDWRNYSKDLANSTLNNNMNQISDLTTDYRVIVELYNETLNEIAPIRTAAIHRTLRV